MLNRIKILGSSSAGCAYILYFDNKVIQLDAGKKNPEPEKVNEVFISHDHPDHIKWLKQFNNVAPMNLTHEKVRHIDNRWESFIVPHKILNNGYIIKEEKEIIAYITDCGKWEDIDIDLSKCTYLFIECNWDEILIHGNKIKASPHGLNYAFTDKGHMSNVDCLKAIYKWKVNKNCKIIFIHKSNEHADWNLTYQIFKQLPNKYMYVAPKEESILYCKAWTQIGKGRIL